MITINNKFNIGDKVKGYRYILYPGMHSHAKGVIIGIEYYVNKFSKEKTSYIIEDDNGDEYTINEKYVDLINGG